MEGNDFKTLLGTALGVILGVLVWAGAVYFVQPDYVAAANHVDLFDDPVQPCQIEILPDLTEATAESPENASQSADRMLTIDVSEIDQ